MMKRMVTLLPFIMVLTACTRAEMRAFARWHHDDPVAAEAFANQPEIQAELAAQAEAAPPGTLPPVVDIVSNARGHCAQWYDEAMAAGFSDEQWNTVDRVMWGESRCRPAARNHSSGATGLMQIMPSVWGSRCGDLYNPSENLRCARLVLDQQGWNAWDVY